MLIVLAADGVTEPARPLSEQSAVKRDEFPESAVLLVCRHGDGVPALAGPRKIRPVPAQGLGRRKPLMNLARPARLDPPIEPVHVAERRPGGHVKAAVGPALAVFRVHDRLVLQIVGKHRRSIAAGPREAPPEQPLGGQHRVVVRLPHPLRRGGRPDVGQTGQNHPQPVPMRGIEQPANPPEALLVHLARIPQDQAQGHKHAHRVAAHPAHSRKVAIELLGVLDQNVFEQGIPPLDRRPVVVEAPGNELVRAGCVGDRESIGVDSHDALGRAGLRRLRRDAARAGHHAQKRKHPGAGASLTGGHDAIARVARLCPCLTIQLHREKAPRRHREHGEERFHVLRTRSTDLT